MVRRKLIYLLLLIVSVFLAILYNSYIILLLSLLLLLFPIILGLIVYYQSKKIQVTLCSDSKIEKKHKEIEAFINVVNPTLFPLPKLLIKTSYCHHFDSKEKEETLYSFVDAKNEQKISIHFTTSFCGNTSIQIKSIRVYDYLNLFSMKKKMKEEITIAILPQFKIFEQKLVMENPNVLLQSEVFSNVKSGDDSSEIFSIHEYKEGDRMNQIHWKLSLKEERIMVKDFGLPIDCSVVILVELYINGKEARLDELDAALENVLSISFTMILNKQQHFIAWYDKRDGLCKRCKIEKEEDLYEAFSYLFQSRVYNESNLTMRFHAAEYEKEPYSNIFYITPSITEDAIKELEETKRNAWCYVIATLKESYITEAVEEGLRRNSGIYVMETNELY